MALMRSPEGEEREIKPAGVASLSRLGWEVIEAEPEPAPKRKAKKSNDE